MMKSKIVICSVCLLILPIIGCGTRDPLVWSNPENIPAEAIEKAFELRIEMHSGTAAHCLDIEGSNPPEPVLEALLAKHYKVVPGLDCKEVSGQEFSYQSPDGQAANLYSFSRFKRNNAADWDVSWMEYMPNAKAKSGASKLMKAGDQWQAHDLLDSRQAWGQ